MEDTLAKDIAAAEAHLKSLKAKWAELEAENQAIIEAEKEAARQSVVKQISQLTSQARELIGQAEQLADEHNIYFEFSVAYGMGGGYTPKAQANGWNTAGWNSSSQDC